MSLFLHLFADALGEHGHDLVEVAHDAQVGNAEDGSKLVLVDGDEISCPGGYHILQSHRQQ